MNEAERDDTMPQPISSGLLELLLKLWFILMLVFMGLWVLGVILMYWYLVVPAGTLFVVWAWWSGRPQDNGAGVTCEVSAWASDEPSSEDDR